MQASTWLSDIGFHYAIVLATNFGSNQFKFMLEIVFNPSPSLFSDAAVLFDWNLSLSHLDMWSICSIVLPQPKIYKALKPS